MFNLTTSNSVGYNGVSQIPDSRCTPPYDNDSSEAQYQSMLHSEGHIGMVLPRQDRKMGQSCKQTNLSKSHQLEDVYTFKDSDLHFSHNLHSNSRLRSPLHKKSDMLDKTLPLSSPKCVKQVNGYSPPRSAVVVNGIHENDKPRQMDGIVSPFSNLVKSPLNKDQFSMGEQRILTDTNIINTEETKSSIIRCNDISNTTRISSQGGGAGTCRAMKVKQEEDPCETLVDIKTEPPGLWSSEGRVTAPLFSSSYKLPSVAPPKKVTPGKPVSSPRCRRGRGPALHEALQRIITHHQPSNTLSLGLIPNNRSSLQSDKEKWTSPFIELFDCSPLDSKQTDLSYNNYAQPWFEGVSGCEPGLGRAERLAARRAMLRRRTTQFARYSQSLEESCSSYHSIKAQLDKVSLVDTCGHQVHLSPPTLDKILTDRGYTTLLTATDRKKIRSGGKLLGCGTCAMLGCEAPAMACAAYCFKHISWCSDQRLFSSCTAKFSDNTQCKMPVINITNHLPLCDEHAWKRDNYNKISQELKPKKAPRKRPKPSAMIRPQKRNRKRKKVVQPATVSSDAASDVAAVLPPTQGSTSSGCEESTEEAGMGLTEEFIEVATNHHIDEEVVAQVLGLQVEEVRAAPSQDNNIDLRAVFNDFFTAEQNEEYIPTREETEELERALEAVNQDVKSLEKLTASQGGTGGNLLLDTFLDERALAETLASLPDVFNPSPNCTA